MLPFFRSEWGNPSSAYSFGHRLGPKLEEARERVAALINADPREILFTSCGTESINTALNCALATQPDKRHVIATAVEHSATLKFCAALQRQGYAVSYLKVAHDGSLDLAELEQTIRPDTALVSVMWANNETGLLFPLEHIGRICRERDVLLHTDAIQMAGKLPIDVRAAEVDFLSLSGHKLHAPKGVGALFVRRHTRFEPYLLGGGQERGRRGGTENVPYVVGFGRASALALSRLEEQNTRVRRLRDKLERHILEQIPGCSRNGAAELRLPNTSNIAFADVEAEGILLLLDQEGICVSSGSACHSGSVDPSHVLLAMGCNSARARSSVRFSLGLDNTEAEVDFVMPKLSSIVNRLRQLVPVASA